MRKINKIVIHCSDSPFGDAKLIDEWHKSRPEPFRCIGYHNVILNGKLRRSSSYNSVIDGKIEKGRPIEEIGAHVHGHNEDSIGICLIGKPTEGIKCPFTLNQIKSLRKLIMEYLAQFNLTAQDVYGHCELDPHKICPGLDMDKLRGALA